MTHFDQNQLPGIFALVGNTPMVDVEILTPEKRQLCLSLKLEGANPSGSLKDRAAVWILKDMISRGILREGSTLLDASSGNMASALALFGKSLGLRVHVICGPTLTAEKQRYLELLGAHMIVSDLGPYTYDAYRMCLSLMSTTRSIDYCFTDQLHNPLNPRSHEMTTGPEIMRQRPNVKAIVGSLGSGGTMTGIGRYVRSQNINVSLVAVSSSVGVRFPGVAAYEDGEYKTPFVLAAEAEGLFSDRELVDRAEVVMMMRQLAQKGILLGPQGGAVASGAVKYADRHKVSDNVVAITGDALWKNLDYVSDILVV